MTISLRKKKPASSSIEYDSPPPNFHIHQSLRRYDLDESKTDEFSFSSYRLDLLRRQNARFDYPVPAKREEDRHKLTVVLDVDETLIHSRMSNEKKCAQDCYNFQLQEAKEVLDHFEIVLSDGEHVTVYKRPGLDEFLEYVAEKYEVMAYTAGLKQYAEPLLNWLDPERKIFRHRLYRESCLMTGSFYVKDLNKVQRDLKRTVLVDNNLCCFIPQLCNGIPITSFYEDPNDDALSVLRSFLETVERHSDVRRFLQGHFNLIEALGTTRQSLLGDE